tara:strand:+ start:204 stop:602 length:399 start_codon:yes stop_codon:yes gene_type:complete
MAIVDHICVIDDDPICVFGIKKTMKELGFCNKIIVYKNGLEAINGLKKLLNEAKKLPSIIFVDLNMPIMDGWEFLDVFTKIPNHNIDYISIYIISSSIDPRDMLKAKTYSAVSNYFIKPINPKALIEIISAT